jgi:hypothetical protein
MGAGVGLGVHAETPISSKLDRRIVERLIFIKCD